jgi:hypothetical protein
MLAPRCGNLRLGPHDASLLEQKGGIVAAFARRFRSLALLVCLATLSPLVAALNTWGTDLSDLWWNPEESGWGANIAHQQEIIFMTLFVYGPDGKAKWYVAPDMRSDSTNRVFNGALYETTGPHFAASSFDPNAVAPRPVGTVTLSVASPNNATLAYSVDGSTASKAIQRQTFRANNLTGAYVGAASGTNAGCGAASGSFEEAASFSIDHSGTTVSMAVSTGNGLDCTYTGTYAQAGRMGTLEGALACSNGARGTFVAFEIEAGHQGFLARYTANYGGGCVETGRIGGLKR